MVLCRKWKKCVNASINSAKEEYELGRDFSVKQDIFGDELLTFDNTDNIFKLKYQGNDVDGNQVDYVYKTDNLASTIDGLATKIYDNEVLKKYVKLLELRYSAGASKPDELNLASLIGGSNLTGAGGSTFFEETVTIDPNDTNMKITTGLGTFNTPTTFDIS